jgi:hypothetical protein
LTRRNDLAKVLLATLFIVVLTQGGLRLAEADTRSLVDSTFVVQNLSYYTVTREIDISNLRNVRIVGTIDVSGGSLNLYVMDPSGYDNFKKTNKPATVLFRADNVQSHSMNLAITQSGTYHIVFDNQAALLSSRTVKIRLDLSFENPTQMLMTYGIVGIVAIVVLVVVILIVRRVRKKSQLSPAAPKLAYPSGTMLSKQCVHCGSVMHQAAKVCPACGKPQ